MLLPLRKQQTYFPSHRGSWKSDDSLLVKLKAQRLLLENRQKLVTILLFNVCLQELQSVQQDRLLSGQKTYSKSAPLMRAAFYRKKAQAILRTSPENNRNRVPLTTQQQTVVVNPALVMFEKLPKLPCKARQTTSFKINHERAKKAGLLPAPCKNSSNLARRTANRKNGHAIRFCR